jgi:hypothetical protein
MLLVLLLLLLLLLQHIKGAIAELAKDYHAKGLAVVAQQQQHPDTSLHGVAAAAAAAFNITQVPLPR